MIVYHRKISTYRNGAHLSALLTLVGVKSARVTAFWIGDRYMRWMKLFMSMTKNNLSN